MNDTQLNVLRIQGHDTATVSTETGEPLQLIRFHAGMDSSPWIALTGRQYEDLLQDMKTRQTSAINYDYRRSD